MTIVQMPGRGDGWNGMLKFRVDRALVHKERQVLSIGNFHDSVIWLQLPEFSLFFFS